jgi:hypothetical protein
MARRLRSHQAEQTGLVILILCPQLEAKNLPLQRVGSFLILFVFSFLPFAIIITLYLSVKIEK